MLFNEPKLLKFEDVDYAPSDAEIRFSALQRAEIAEMTLAVITQGEVLSFSALQRAEIAEISINHPRAPVRACFSALQRAEIAEIQSRCSLTSSRSRVSVLFNEPKLLKSCEVPHAPGGCQSFSALQRAEIAEISSRRGRLADEGGFSALQRAEIAEIENGIGVPLNLCTFQCSSTSRNC